jgi:hypothetical protein
VVILAYFGPFWGRFKGHFWVISSLVGFSHVYKGVLKGSSKSAHFRFILGGWSQGHTLYALLEGLDAYKPYSHNFDRVLRPILNCIQFWSVLTRIDRGPGRD